MDTSTEFEKKEVRLVLNFVYSKLGRYFFMLQETCSEAAQCTRVLFIREKYKICSMKWKTVEQKPWNGE